jgi:hypothetical protein
VSQYVRPSSVPVVRASVDNGADLL